MAEGKTPGDGKVSPFGNHKGAPASGASGKPTDFVKSPTGGGNAPKSGGKDFVKDPSASGQTNMSAQDYTKQPGPTPRPEVVPNPQEIPAGGKTLYADPGKVQTQVSGTTDAGRKPFKVGK